MPPLFFLLLYKYDNLPGREEQALAELENMFGSIMNFI